MKLTPVIGLEIHLQLKTKSKMFCSCDNRGEFLPPNTAVCPVCLGHPGTLPVPNESAIFFALKMGATLGCKINERCRFDRKHYFYPDLPKGYQISQYDVPICGTGELTISIPGVKAPRAKATIRIHRAHLEEDAAKSLHGRVGETLVDFNRSGTPLLEIVTEPDLQTPEEAKYFLQELRLIARALKISDADMEKGHMRCDANISLRPINETRLYPKTEIKNLNSFRSVERALAFEIKRQTDLWESGAQSEQTTTRGWDDVKSITVEQRTKEAAEDYRYLPEPDIPPLNVKSINEQARRDLPELPAAKRARFVNEYGFTASDARQMIDGEEIADFAEHVMSEFFDWIKSIVLDTDENELRQKAAKLVSGWILSKYLGILSDLGKPFTTHTVSAENFAEFLMLLHQNKINSVTAQQILRAMSETGADPSHILEERDLTQAGTDQIGVWADKVIEEYTPQVAQYRAGKKTVLQFLIGQLMRKSRGTASPDEAKNELLKRIQKNIL